MKHTIFTDKAPQPIGPYSQAIRAGNLVFLSGQIGIDPQTQDLVSGGIAEEMGQILKNIDAILVSADLTKTHLIKLSIYITDLNDFFIINRMLEDYLEKEYPARETIQVSGLPKNAKIEVSALACAEC